MAESVGRAYGWAGEIQLPFSWVNAPNFDNAAIKWWEAFESAKRYLI